MMSESDIVERLRLLVPSDSSGAAIKAIDELTRLRSERSNLIGTVRFHKEQADALRAKVEKLEADLATARADALEEAARCAEQNAAETWTDPNATDTRGIMRLQAEDIAAAIRAYGRKPDRAG